MSTFLPSLHDVFADNTEVIREALACLESWGLPQIPLLVVPGQLENPRDPPDDFQKNLQEWAQRGCELLCHGWVHRRNSGPGGRAGSWIHRMAGDEAEFAGLPARESLALLEKALRAWEKLDVGPALGFVPPTWYGNSYLRAQVGQLGWRLYESRAALHVLSGTSCLASHSRPPISLAGLGVLEGMARGLSPYFAYVPGGRWRLALHPSDFAPLHLASTERLVRSLVERCRRETYKDFLGDSLINS